MRKPANSARTSLSLTIDALLGTNEEDFVSNRGMKELAAAMDDPTNQTGSGAWARAASDNELEYHIDGGLPGNRAYEAASRELARRAATRAERTQLSWIKRTFWTTIILGIAAIGATLLT
jgi:hypothetical protein